MRVVFFNTRGCAVTNSLPIGLVKNADSLLISALPLIGRHNLNATDAIILQSCLDFQTNLVDDRLILCTSDKRLVRAANEEELATIDPEVDTLTSLVNLLLQ